MTTLDPESGKQFLSNMEALLAQRKYELVQELAAERLWRRPDDMDARIAMCKAWTKMGRLDQVGEILRDVETRIADWSRIYAAMGDICRESGLQKEAARFYQRFLELHAQPEGQQAAAETMDRLMDAGAAAYLAAEEKDHYTQIAEVAEDFRTMTLADLYLRQNHPEMAREVLREILQRNPDDAEAAARLKEVTERLSAPQRKPAADSVVMELTRWLRNVGRIGTYAT